MRALEKTIRYSIGTGSTAKESLYTDSQGQIY